MDTGQVVVRKVFVIYASKDWPFYERLTGHARTEGLHVEFDHVQVKQPWFAAWKAHCRARIYECDAAIVLVSRNTIDGGIDWELECATEFGFPMLGINVDKDKKGSVPKEPPDWTVIDWEDWPGVASFLQLVKRQSAS